MASRLVLGAHKWSRIDPNQYAAVVQSAVENGWTTLECGQDGGEQALGSMLRTNYPPDAEPLHIMARIGYRTIPTTNNNNDENDDKTQPGNNDTTEVLQDVVMEEPQQREDGSVSPTVVHNVGRHAVEHFLQKTPLLGTDDESGSSNVRVVPMLHNPEVHEDKQDRRQRLTDAFSVLEEAVAETSGRNSPIDGFGVVSNGLSLPTQHPLYLDWKEDVLEAACEAASQVTGQRSKLSVLQLPANLLETRGIKVAREVFAYANDEGLTSSPYFPDSLRVYAMRPLTCYPDLGTGTGHGFEMVDFVLPIAPGQTASTHEMDNPPAVYGQTLNAAMGHFDGTELIEAKQERDLSAEERETLDGCKLLQSLLHDLDAGLETVRSFAAHEEDLMTKVIPTLYGTLEEVDEESSALLQAFFQAHGLAVRHAIARNTRKLLKQGGDGVPPYEIPNEMRLQEYALQHILDEPAFAKVVVGCMKPEEVRDNVEIDEERTKTATK